jgi:glycosyltransferase involved in cell wall biosynthesis
VNTIAPVVAVYALLVLLWGARRLFVAVFRRRLTFLTPQYGGLASLAPPPLVSIIIPAKDEEEAIGPCLESVLAQDYANLEVIVIEDRSRDRTAEVIQAIARRDPRVRLIRNDRLPLGWTGKTHALVRAAGEARGEWMWFLDADTRHHPATLSVMLEFARREGGAEMVSTLMGMRNESFWERVVQPLGGIILMSMFDLFRANRTGDARGGFANGQSILVRRAAYEAVGGHAAVRDQFLEDVQLGRLLKARGHSIKVAMAPGLSTTRMYTSLGGITRGWSRIYYGASGPNAARLLRSQLSLLGTSMSAYLVPWLLIAAGSFGAGGGALAAAWGLNLLHLALVHDTMFHLYGFTGSDRRYLVLYPLSCLVVVYTLARATAMCFTHRVTWRGTHYRRQYKVHPASDRAGLEPHASLVHH